MRLQSDERLGALAMDGHEAAFAAIVDRYRTPLLRYCAGIVGASRAEDAVQQVLINAHDAFTRTNDVRHLRSWLYRIAHNTSLNVLRAVRDDVPLDARQAAVAAGPADAYERSERLRATLVAVRDLPERQRAALVLRELEGRSHEEIATALGVTTGSARQHLMRARTAVRGAVTAITPYPLIAKLAEVAMSPSAGSWGDAAVGAGAGATVVKLTAGVLATGALVGGAVGTTEVVHRRDRSQPVSTHATKRVHAPAQAVTAATENAALKLPARATSGAGGAPVQTVRHRGGSSSGSGTGKAGSGGSEGSGGAGAVAGSGSSGSSGNSGRGSSGSDDTSRRSGDDSDRNTGDDTRGTSGKGTSGSGSGSGSGKDSSGRDDTRTSDDSSSSGTSGSKHAGSDDGAALGTGTTRPSEDIKPSSDDTPPTSTTGTPEDGSSSSKGSSSGSGSSGSGSSGSGDLPTDTTSHGGLPVTVPETD
jgi:RNA polymerase sigma factor (sigma-70 family)